ncbi:MAG TPA: glycosyltransferase, partial [Gammaproteobacteria bacterium]
MIQIEQTTQPHRLSIIIPMYNEADNVVPMAGRVHEVFVHYGHPWELILINDGSDDATEETMRAVSRDYGPHVRIINLQRNFGQTAALQAGID